MANPDKTAGEINAEIRALGKPNTPNVRAVRRRYSKRLKEAPAQEVMAVARVLLAGYGHRWVAYELIADHAGAFASLGERELEDLGSGIDSWWTVDAFARTLAGPVWLAGQVSDGLIRKWARSGDRWWRRAALVSTVALNRRSQGGMGDAERTLQVCSLLVADHDDMVVKALSWALRALAPHDPAAVRDFLYRNDDALAARVKREVGNKLATGLKSPRRSR